MHSPAIHLRTGGEAAERAAKAARDPAEDMLEAARTVERAATYLRSPAADLRTGGKAMERASQDLVVASDAAKEAAEEIASSSDAAVKALQKSIEDAQAPAEHLRDAGLAIKDAAKAIEAATKSVVDALDKDRDDRPSLAKAIIDFLKSENVQALAFAAALFTALFFLAQWSWHILDSLNDRRTAPDWGDPKFAIDAYLLATLSLCLIGAGFFAVRYVKSALEIDWKSVNVWHLLLVLSAIGIVFLGPILLVAWLRAFCTLSNGKWSKWVDWLLLELRKLACRFELLKKLLEIDQSKTWGFRTAVVLLAVLGFPGLFHAYCDETTQAIRLLMFIVFVMFGIGTDAVVRRDDFRRLLRGYSFLDHPPH